MSTYGAITKDPYMAAMAGVAGSQANRILRQRGSSMAGVTARAASKPLMSAGKVIEKIYPAYLQGSFRGTKWEKLFDTVAQQGARAFPAYHHLLYNNDPEYRQYVDALEAK
jgi:hypothetical protein